MTLDEMLAARDSAEAVGRDQRFVYDAEADVMYTFCRHCNGKRKTTSADDIPEQGWSHAPGCACQFCTPQPRPKVVSMSGWLTSHGRTAR